MFSSAPSGSRNFNAKRAVYPHLHNCQWDTGWGEREKKSQRLANKKVKMSLFQNMSRTPWHYMPWAVYLDWIKDLSQHWLENTWSTKISSDFAGVSSNSAHSKWHSSLILCFILLISQINICLSDIRILTGVYYCDTCEILKTKWCYLCPLQSSCRKGQGPVSTCDAKVEVCEEKHLLLGSILAQTTCTH